MDVLTTMPPALLAVLGLLLLAWVVLLFLVPFIIEGIRNWTRKSHAELEQINRKLDRLNSLLAARTGPLPPPAPPGNRSRKEPTISDYPSGSEPERRPPPRYKGNARRRD
jgi:hypothetical protein